MDKLKSNTEKLVDGLHKITGIRKSAIKDYADKNNIFDIIDHPMTIGVTDKQLGKLKMLKDFINSYHYLRKNEAEDRITLNTPEIAGNYFISQMAYYRDREVVLCAYLDAKLHILSCECISEGTVGASAIFPREVLKRAIQLDCRGLMLSHNHPGGDPMPSREDIAVTKRFHIIFGPLEMQLYDHFVVGDNKYLSMNEQGMLMSEFDKISKADYSPISINGVKEYEEEYEFLG
jgi:DNA repair protein RadC